MGQLIHIETTINAPIEQVWTCFTEAQHIENWNFASTDWHCKDAHVDLRIGGKQTSRMESVDGSIGFDFGMTFTDIIVGNELVMRLDDGRYMDVYFIRENDVTLVEENFEAEDENSLELQQEGWQSILNRFRDYVESVATETTATT